MPAITVGNPTGGTTDYIATVKQVGTLPNVIVGSGTLQSITNLPSITVSSMPTTTVQWSNQTIGVSDGTLRAVTQIGTLPNVIVGSGTLQTLNSGTLQYIGSIGTMPTTTVQWSNQTVGVTDGTLRTVTQVGTLPNVTVGSGTIQTLNSGTLQYVGNIGTIPNVIVGSGTLQAISGNINVIPQSGTLQTVSSVTNVAGFSATIGTLGTLNTLTSVTNIAGFSATVGTLGTLHTLSNCYLAGAGTVKVASGTVNLDLTTVPSGTLKVNVVAGGAGGGAAQLEVTDSVGAYEKVGLGTYRTVPISGTIVVSTAPTTTVQWTSQTVGVTDGTLRTVTQIGTLPNIVVGSGTLQQVTLVPTVTTITNPVTVTWGLGTANPTAGTLDTVTRVGTLPNVIIGSGTLQAISGNVGVIVQSGTLQAISGNVPTIVQSGTLQQVTLVATIGTIGTLPTSNCGTVYYQNNLGTCFSLGTISAPVYARQQVRLAGAPGAFADIGAGTYSPMPILGTVSMVNAGTINTIDKGTITTVSLVTAMNSLGTLNSGTLTTVSTVTTVASVTNIAGISATLGTLGTLNYLVNVGTLYAVTGNVKTIPQSGTLQQITNCYLAGQGTVNVSSGTIITNFGPINKGIIYSAGTWLFAGTTSLFGVAGSLTPTNPTNLPCIFRTYIVLNEANNIWVTRAPAGSTPVINEKLNCSGNLTANSAYLFDFIVNSNDKINFQLGNAGTVSYISITEVPVTT
jgi:hypothetical protein